jgi:hypothetical protein
MLLPDTICAVMAAGFAVQTWTLPHYFAPATGALYILLVQCLRQLWHWRLGGRAIGPELVQAIPSLACVMILLRLTAVLLKVPIEPPWPRGNLERARILRQLQQQPGEQLVIVRYDAHHDINLEWVYNDADIDRAKVVWARDMGADGNRELLNYFHDRSVWVVEGDSSAPQLENYAN